VNHLDRASRADQLFSGRAECLTGGKQQRRTKSFSAGKDTPANRRVDALRLC